ncbi:hypothetical protein JCM15831A_22130 [Asaia astilbis]
MGQKMGNFDTEHECFLRDLVCGGGKSAQTRSKANVENALQQCAKRMKLT